MRFRNAARPSGGVAGGFHIRQSGKTTDEAVLFQTMHAVRGGGGGKAEVLGGLGPGYASVLHQKPQGPRI